MKFYDLNIHPENLKEAGDIVKTAEKLGWHGICLVEYFNDLNNFKKFSEGVLNLKKDTALEIFTGAKIKAKNIKDIRKNARKSLNYADIIFACGDFNINREFQIPEIDVLSYPERGIQRDFNDQKNSGIDHIISKLLAGHKAAYEINFSGILDSYGIVRAQIMGRIIQNIKLSRKYNFLTILASGAGDMYGMRAPLDFIAVAKALGMTGTEAKNSVTRNPEKILVKSINRKNPDVIMEGLEVVDWGGQKPDGNKMFGWY